MKGLTVANWFETSPAGIDLIKRFEGCEKRLPDNRLTTYKIGADPETIGWGQTGRMPDGRPVVMGLVITQQEADDALEYFVRNVVEPMVRKHFGCQSQHEFDACASWVYNVRHDKLERGGYTLPQHVNRKSRDVEALVNLWLRYIHTPGFENGLYKRRIAEVLMFLGLPWNAPAVWGFVTSALYKTRAGAVAPTDPWFIIDLAESAAPPATPPAVIEEPIPEVPVAPNLDPDLPPKPMEESDTHRGLSKAESGKETAIIGGVLTGLGAMLPNIQAITAYLAQFDGATILAALSVIGIGIAGVGGWRWWRGRIIAYEGRITAKQAKV
jgi:GH24 family phage-related lysozyme (muramidase)